MSLMQSLPFSNTGLGQVRNDWTRAEIAALFSLPFPELMFEAQRVHRLHFDPTEVQISTLLSIKTGGCSEDCGYCPQSAHHDTGVKAEKLMAVDAGIRAPRVLTMQVSLPQAGYGSAEAVQSFYRALHETAEAASAGRTWSLAASNSVVTLCWVKMTTGRFRSRP